MKNRSQSDTLREKQVRKGERSMLTEQIFLLIYLSKFYSTLQVPWKQLLQITRNDHGIKDFFGP